MGVENSASIFATPDKAAEASPFTYIDRSEPPFLIFHGNKDYLVSPVGSAELANRLKDAGVSVQRYVVDGAGHATAEFVQPKILDMIIDFLNKNLNN